MLDLAVIDSVEPDRVAAELVAALRGAHARDRDQHAATLGLEKLLRIRTDRVEVRQELADHLLEAVRAGVGPAPGQALGDDDLGRVARRRYGGVEVALSEGIPTASDCVRVSTHRCLLTSCPLLEPRGNQRAGAAERWIG